MIIPDFRFRRSNRSFEGLGIGFRRTEDQVVFGGQGNLDRLDAAGAGDLKPARKAALEPDVGHNVLWSAVLVEHLGLPFGSQLANLLGFFAQFNRSRSHFQVEIDRLPLQLAYLEFHAMSLRRGPRRVNAFRHLGTTKDPPAGGTKMGD